MQWTLPRRRRKTTNRDAVNLAIESDLGFSAPPLRETPSLFLLAQRTPRNAKALGAAKGGSLHGIILRQAPSISNLSDAIVTLLALTVCLGVATLSWHFFERPIVQYGQRIRYRG